MWSNVIPRAVCPTRAAGDVKLRSDSRDTLLERAAEPGRQLLRLRALVGVALRRRTLADHFLEGLQLRHRLALARRLEARVGSSEVEEGDLLAGLVAVAAEALGRLEGVREVMSMDFDVVICDMMMPQMPGDMFYLAVQRTKPHLCSRFIFITGHSGNPKVEEFIKKVNGLVLFKPVQIEELVRMISLAMKRGQSAA